MNSFKLNGLWSISRYDFKKELPLFENELGEPLSTFSGHVPGDVSDDLMKNGIIKNIYYNENIKDCAFTADSDWCYTTVFSVDELNKLSELVFEGIDTYAVIYFNGKLIGSADNMFIAHRFDVTDSVKKGQNRLSVYIRSIKHIMEAFPSDKCIGCFNQKRMYVRKAQCQFGWDWAPDYPSVGIWKSAFFITRNGHSIDSLRFQTHTDGRITMFYQIRTNQLCKPEGGCKIVLTVDGNCYEAELSDYKGLLNFEIENPRLWWPHDMGEQYLYSYKLEYFENGLLCDKKEGRFAIRTIDVCEKPKADGRGLTFGIHINGKPAFFKGANWVPLDVLPAVVDKERYIKALSLAKRGNINALRVWGGGIYEKDEFFDLCDEYGILIWQDFAFACAELPDFYFGLVDSIKSEIVSIVNRLCNHPCIAIWCGGNERVGCFEYSECMGKDIFDYLIRGIVAATDPSRPYVPTSPFSYSTLGGNSESGDNHSSSFYSCTVTKSWDCYREKLIGNKNNFLTEICVMGCSPLKSLRKFLPESELNLNSSAIDFHLRSNPYDGRNTTFFADEKADAQLLFGKLEGFSDFVKKSMCLQSELTTSNLEYHLSRRGQCSGTLLWMYNDTWPCGTWAMVDYYMQPKAGYYAAKRAFAPTAVYIVKNENGIVAYLTNDNNEKGIVTVGKATVCGQLLYSEVIEEAPTVPSYLFKFDTQDNTPNSYYFIRFKSENNEYTATYFTDMWKDIRWEMPQIHMKNIKTGDSCVELLLTSDKYARFVRLDGIGVNAYYSDNYFDIACGDSKRIVIEGNALDISKLKIDHFLTEWTD